MMSAILILRHVFCATLAATGVMGASGAPAQQRGGAPAAAAPASHENLKVLPPDIPQAQLLQTMQGFAQALGVQCGHCHAGAPASDGGARGAARGRGPATPQLNYVSDDMPAKRAAREMMRLVQDLNARVPAAVSKSAEATARVQCVTCHRGVAIPRQLADVLAQTVQEKGTAAAVAQYKELRKQFFGAQAYDFGEATLINFAQRATAPEDQTTWLRLNLEYFPLSSRTYVALAAVQQKANARGEAVKSLTRAAELDPQNARVKSQLEQLKDAK